MTSKKVLAHALACVAALSIAVTGCTKTSAGAASPAPAAPGEVTAAAENGPAPTAASVRAASGPFRYTQRVVTGAGFASATLYTPTGTSGKTGGILLVPPFLVNNSALLPQAQLYASNGFTVLSLNARTTADFPTARANQGRAALNVLKAQPNVDASRLGIGGYSMGGGATMEIISINPDPGIKAGVPQVPWNPGRTFSQDRVPVMIIGGSADTVAAPAQNASVFYASVPASVPKGIAIVSGASHFIPSTPTPGMRQVALAWMKYYVDGDSRYKQFITNPGGMSRFNVSGVE